MLKIQWNELYSVTHIIKLHHLPNGVLLQYLIPNNALKLPKFSIYIVFPSFRFGRNFDNKHDDKEPQPKTLIKTNKFKLSKSSFIKGGSK